MPMLLPALRISSCLTMITTYATGTDCATYIFVPVWKKLCELEQPTRFHARSGHNLLYNWRKSHMPRKLVVCGACVRVCIRMYVCVCVCVCL
uniref:Putative secreted protein n=1 Tax=Anopheles darlingi TaxID=43151 RepID=A0A2M4D0B9_ANODA